MSVRNYSNKVFSNINENIRVNKTLGSFATTENITFRRGVKRIEFDMDSGDWTIDGSYLQFNSGVIDMHTKGTDKLAYTAEIDVSTLSDYNDLKFLNYKKTDNDGSVTVKVEGSVSGEITVDDLEDLRTLLTDEDITINVYFTWTTGTSPTLSYMALEYE